MFLFFLEEGEGKHDFTPETGRREFRKSTRLSISLQETRFLCNNPTHNQRARKSVKGRHLFLPPPGGHSWLLKKQEQGKAEEVAQPGDAGPRRGGRGGGACQPPPSVISAGVTVAPVAGTSPEPQRAGSRGAVPRSCPPPRVPSPYGPFPPVHSLSSSASPLFPKNETSSQRTPSLQRSAPVIPGNCPFRATLRVSSYPPGPTEVSIHYSPKHPRSSQRAPPPPGCPGLEAVGGQPHP